MIEMHGVLDSGKYYGDKVGKKVRSFGGGGLR